MVVNVDNHGKTNWAKGLKVEVETPDGKERAYFLKVSLHSRLDICCKSPNMTDCQYR